MRKQVRVGIIGMGIGRPNALAIAKNPRGRVVALCDLAEDRMKDFAKELPEPVAMYTDLMWPRKSGHLGSTGTVTRSGTFTLGSTYA